MREDRGYLHAMRRVAPERVRVVGRVVLNTGQRALSQMRLQLHSSHFSLYFTQPRQRTHMIFLHKPQNNQTNRSNRQVSIPTRNGNANTRNLQFSAVWA